MIARTSDIKCPFYLSAGKKETKNKQASTWIRSGYSNCNLFSCSITVWNSLTPNIWSNEGAF